MSKIGMNRPASWMFPAEPDMDQEGEFEAVKDVTVRKIDMCTMKESITAIGSA